MLITHPIVKEALCYLGAALAFAFIVYTVGALP